MTYFNKSGSIYNVFDGSEITDVLPALNFILKFDTMRGFYLEKADAFKLPPKIYGNTNKNSERILRTFQERQRNTGVLMVGEKGSGKTLLMRKICIDSGLPAIIINSSFVGDDFNTFLSSITQPVIIIFDEFEKIYKQEKQEHVLTLLDGTYQSNKLFLITSNNKFLIDHNMKNRPGRIYYFFEFAGLDESFIREYCSDNLLDKTKVEKIIDVSQFFEKFNFDMLSAIVEELNRYGEDPFDLMSILNAKPEYSDKITYSLQVKIGDNIVPKNLTDKRVSVNPYTDTFGFYIPFCWETDSPLEEKIYTLLNHESSRVEDYIQFLDKKDLHIGRTSPSINNASEDSVYVKLKPEHIIEVSAGRVTYRCDNGFIVILTRVQTNSNLAFGYNYDYSYPTIADDEYKGGTAIRSNNDIH